MKKYKRDVSVTVDLERLLPDLQSTDEAVRARAVRSLCPCRGGWSLFEQHLNLLARLKKDRNPLVHSHALHVFQDAAETQSSGLPTNPREVTNEMLRTRRASRFRSDEDEGRPDGIEKGKRRRGRG